MTHPELPRNRRWWNLDAVSLFSLQLLDARGFHRHEIFLRVAKDFIELCVFPEAAEYQGWVELTMSRACYQGPSCSCRSVAVPLRGGAAVPSGGPQLCGVSLLAQVPSCCNCVCKVGLPFHTRLKGRAGVLSVSQLQLLALCLELSVSSAELPLSPSTLHMEFLRAPPKALFYLLSSLFLKILSVHMASVTIPPGQALGLCI